MNKSAKVFLVSMFATFTTITLIILAVLFHIFRIGSTADCAWFSSAKTWIDSNRDGILNNGELPISGIAIHVDDQKNELTDVAVPVATDKDGSADLQVWLPGCPDVDFEVYTDMPDGYKLTTQPRIAVDKNLWGSLDSETIYYFGFASIQ